MAKLINLGPFFSKEMGETTKAKGENNNKVTKDSPKLKKSQNMADKPGKKVKKLYFKI